MATHALDAMYSYAHVKGSGNPETVRVPVAASTTGISNGSMIRCSNTEACAVKVAGRQTDQLLGLAQWTMATTGTEVRGTLRPIFLARPGDLYIGSLNGALAYRRPTFYAARTRTDTTNSRYYGVLSTASSTAALNVCSALTFFSDQGTFTTGAWMGGRSTSADSSGSTVRGTNAPTYTTGDTNPRLIFTWSSNAFYY